jgi:CelD/BcsL family acetyltransferase involved in cellulose biosynthesis
LRNPAEQGGAKRDEAVAAVPVRADRWLIKSDLSMRVTEHRCFQELEPSKARWNELARGVPFRRWEWLATWWEHYGCGTAEQPSQMRLLIAAVWDGDTLVGVAPWYHSRTWADGRTIRMLGGGEVCSDYLTILCEPSWEDRVAKALADWLTLNTNGRTQSATWDVVELAGVAEGDTAVGRLVDHLSDTGCAVYRRRGLSCWRINLPASWEEFVARLSKSHRKQVRRAARELESGRVIRRRAVNLEEFKRGFEILVDLHQRRWQSLGERGCFASPRFVQFHRDTCGLLFAEGAAELTWLKRDGLALAAEYHLVGNQTVYAYQSGIDPDRLKDQPGRLGAVATIRASIELGRRTFDFLRGDEPYKAHWRAQPQRMWEIQIVQNRAAARLRHGMLLATDSVKNWIKSGLTLAGLR